MNVVPFTNIISRGFRVKSNDEVPILMSVFDENTTYDEIDQTMCYAGGPALFTHKFIEKFSKLSAQENEETQHYGVVPSRCGRIFRYMQEYDSWCETAEGWVVPMSINSRLDWGEGYNELMTAMPAVLRDKMCSDIVIMYCKYDDEYIARQAMWFLHDSTLFWTVFGNNINNAIVQYIIITDRQAARNLHNIKMYRVDCLDTQIIEDLIK